MNDKTVTKHIKRRFSREEKQRYYNLWKESGLPKIKFCKEQNLSPSAFTQWCNNQNSWLPVIPNMNSYEHPSPKGHIELKIPLEVKFCLYTTSAILVLLEIFHAIAAIW